MPINASKRVEYEPWKEALRALNKCLRDTKNEHERAMILGSIAQIVLLDAINGKLSRIPIPDIISQ